MEKLNQHTQVERINLARERKTSKQQEIEFWTENENCKCVESRYI